MTVIGDLCDQIMKHLTRLGLTTQQNMLPGISVKKIHEITTGLPFVLPDSVIHLYEWSEGLNSQAGIGNDFFPGFGMDSLTEMMEMYRELSSEWTFPRFKSSDWQWFPIFRSGGTDFYGVCCTDSPASDAAIVFDVNEGDHRDCVTLPIVEFLNLEAMLRTLLKCYETDVYYIDERGALGDGVITYYEEGPLKGYLKDVDNSQFKEVAREFNPGLKCWL